MPITHRKILGNFFKQMTGVKTFSAPAAGALPKADSVLQDFTVL